MDNFDRKRTVCFSGHRPEKLPDGGDPDSQITKMLKSVLYTAVLESIDAGYDTFVTGLARGVDLWAGEIILELKARGNPVKLVAASPYRGHGSNFRGRDKFILGSILSRADETVYVSEVYSRDCMRRRNEYMVNLSGKLIAVVSDYKSGTGQTIRCAQSQGLEVRIIDAGELASQVDQLAF